MASLLPDIQANVSIPDNLQINLIREDYFNTANNYRLFGEIFLSTFWALAGSILSLYSNSVEIHLLFWFALGFCALFTIIFFILFKVNLKMAKAELKE